MTEKHGILKFREVVIKYSDEDIKALARKFEWKGTGTEQDPIIIENNERITRIFEISGSALFININNCEFIHIILSMCQNISFEKCSFGTLALSKSSNNTAINSSISRLSLYYSSNNCFRECSIIRGSNSLSRLNIFKDCTIKDKLRKKLQTKPIEPSDMLIYIPMVIAISGFAVAFYIFSSIYFAMPFDFNIFILLVVIFSFTALYFFLLKFFKKMERKIGKEKK